MTVRPFLARNRMVTRVVAKQAKTAKVQNNFINGKKKFKRILSCLFGGRGKVQFALHFIFVVGSATADRLSSQHFAAVSTSNIAQLVPSGIFCP